MVMLDWSCGHWWNIAGQLCYETKVHSYCTNVVKLVLFGEWWWIICNRLLTDNWAQLSPTCSLHCTWSVLCMLCVSTWFIDTLSKVQCRRMPSCGCTPLLRYHMGHGLVDYSLQTVSLITYSCVVCTTAPGCASHYPHTLALTPF